MPINNLISLLEDKVTNYNYLIKDIEELKQKKEKQLEILDDLTKVRSIFQTASKLTQSMLSKRVETIVSNALEAVFPDPYKFRIDFVERRNSTECDLLFEKDGNTRDPMDSCGFGAADIAALALRVAYWKLTQGSRNVLILDEPTRALSKDKQKLASLVFKGLSRLDGGLQFIIVTHNQDLAESADRTFIISQKNRISTIKRLPEVIKEFSKGKDKIFVIGKKEN
jgi:DNA repair exonuclease SbcCD ATPase subunit